MSSMKGRAREIGTGKSVATLTGLPGYPNHRKFWANSKLCRGGPTSLLTARPKVLWKKRRPEQGHFITIQCTGYGVLLRAVSQAYRQAIVNASKTGVAQETVKNVVQSSKRMTEQEARMILGMNEKATVEDMLEKYENLFERNAKSGSFYLQSKVQRAKECLEASQEIKVRDNT